jgi:AcrR family transcriptional regulator
MATNTPDTPYQRTASEGNAAVRRALLDVASELLTEQGPQGLSMRRIAERAGCSTMVLYTLFQSKQNLTEALYLEGFARLQQALEAASEGDDPFVHLTELAGAYRAAALAHPSYYSIMFDRPIPEFRPSPESRQRAIESLAMFTTVVERCVHHGVFHPDDPVLVTSAIWAAVHGAVSLELAGYFANVAEADHCFTLAVTATTAWFLAQR